MFGDDQDNDNNGSKITIAIVVTHSVEKTREVLVMHAKPKKTESVTQSQCLFNPVQQPVQKCGDIVVMSTHWFFAETTAQITDKQYGKCLKPVFKNDHKILLDFYIHMDKVKKHRQVDII